MARTTSEIEAELQQTRAALRPLMSIPALVPINGRTVDLTLTADVLKARIAALEAELNGPQAGGIRQGPWLAP